MLFCRFYCRIEACANKKIGDYTMKKLNLIALAAAFSVVLTALPMMVRGDETAFDTANDPLISLSYIEKVLTPAIDKKIADLEAKISQGNTGSEDNSDNSDNTGTTPTVSSGYEVVHIKNGETLLAKTSCEIILRTGSATIVSATVNGLNDITSGDELLDGVDVPLYHCLLVPRGNDGRGILITSDEAYVMVRGEYEIVE